LNRRARKHQEADENCNKELHHLYSFLYINKVTDSKENVAHMGAIRHENIVFVGKPEAKRPFGILLYMER
jgi:hypothetical protein